MILCCGSTPNSSVANAKLSTVSYHVCVVRYRYRCSGEGRARVLLSCALCSFVADEGCEVERVMLAHHCNRCSGEGRARVRRRVSVRVPAGVDEACVMRLHGMGDAGLKGGPAGDLVLRFKVSERGRAMTAVGGQGNSGMCSQQGTGGWRSDASSCHT
jgi:hypothetical protein